MECFHYLKHGTHTHTLAHIQDTAQLKDVGTSS